MAVGRRSTAIKLRAFPLRRRPTAIKLRAFPLRRRPATCSRDPG